MRQLDEHAQAQAQVGFADRLLLSKTDLVGEAQIDAECRSACGKINPRALNSLLRISNWKCR